ncbi:MAG: hypothetical protein KAJ05_09080 [Candidatus Latescibacteria bacterium]|nr:hypothetical protein [Candidatus Latescibacterota bacterium]
MSYRVRLEATMGAFGDLTTDRRSYQPLDTVTVRITGRDSRDQQCKIKVCDDQLCAYHEADVELSDNVGETSFYAAGALGVHWIYLYFPDSDRHVRYANFVVDGETAVETGNPDYDTLYPITKEALLLSRRDFSTERGRFVGYISGDTWQIDGVWLRDWIYQLPAYQYWERDMTCGLDRFLEAQESDGSIPDGIKRDGSTWRMAVESDVEYIFVLGVYDTWKVTGDDVWLAQALPRLEKALGYIQDDEKRWDEAHQLVKRGHTCDTWDFELHGSAEFSGKRFVVATCDQSGYYLAYKAMAEMFRHLSENDPDFGLEAGEGNPQSTIRNPKSRQAEAYDHRAETYRNRANELLWDGGKYLHHVHLTPIEHPGFDESRQLAMGNVWAITRGLSDHAQAVAVIQEYRRRHEETGDAFPWWSLQPGYPDELGYYDEAYCQQGGYANGGLMPWVGGELCRASFEHGMERHGLELYRNYVEHLRRTGNRVHVWYWPDGQPGFRTTNEVPHTGWGMAEWLHALIEGLAGLKDVRGRMQTMEVAPRWAATSEKEIRAAVRYAANKDYFAYRMNLAHTEKIIRLEYAGSGRAVRFHVLLPDGWQPESVSMDGEAVSFDQEEIEQSLYANFSCSIEGLGRLEIGCS